MTGAAAFADPDAWHRPIAYWFWHHLPEDGQIRTQLRRIRDAGFGGFQIQARLSYPLEGYLDEDYLRACGVAADEAAALGLTVGIYDDYNWQTGHAAGRAVRGRDELRERHLFWTRVTIEGGLGAGEISGIRSATENLGPAAMAWHYEGAIPRWTDWRVEQVIGARSRGGRNGDAGVGTEIPDGLGISAETPEGLGISTEIVGREDGCGIRVATESGAESALVLVSARCATSRLVNPLDPEAMARFVEVGLEPFVRAFGDHLGTTVRYVFFDQPHAVYYDWAEREGDPRSSIPFHERFADELHTGFGEDLAPVWAAVIEETDDAFELALRARFWGCFSDYAMETEIGPLAEWSRGHGLLQTGHEVLSHVGSWTPGTAFDNWELRANFGLDHFGVDRFRDLTAVDAQDGIAQLSPVLGDSIARASGRSGIPGGSGTMVEQYFMTPPPGGTPWSGHWGLTPEQLREVSLRHLFAGMRQMIFHGFTQTDGHGGDHESLVNPRFDFPPGINFEPWFDGVHRAYADEASRISTFLDGIAVDTEVALLWPLRTFWTHGTSGDHAEHLGAWARELTAAGVDFRIVDERQLRGLGEDLPGLRALILPAVRTLADAGSVDALRALCDRGVRIVTSGSTPDLLQTGERLSPASWDGLDTESVGLGSRMLEPVRDALRRGEPEPGASSDVRAQLADRGVLVKGGFDAEGTVRIALANLGGEPLGVRVPDGFSEWSASDGTMTPVAAAAAKRDAISAGSSAPVLWLEPGEVRLLVGEREEDGLKDSSDPLHGLELIGHWAAPGAPAVMSEGWTLQIPGGEPLEIDVESGWEKTLPTFSGTGVYRSRFVVESEWLALDLAVRLPAVAGCATVRVNGHDIGTRGWRPFRFDIPSAVIVAGENRMEIEVSGTAANGYYAGTGLRPEPEPEPDGLLAAPVLEAKGQANDGIAIR